MTSQAHHIDSLFVRWLGQGSEASLYLVGERIQDLVLNFVLWIVDVDTTWGGASGVDIVASDIGQVRPGIGTLLWGIAPHH
jgi:hypothetical protein